MNRSFSNRVRTALQRLAIVPILMLGLTCGVKSYAHAQPRASAQVLTQTAPMVYLYDDTGQPVLTPDACIQQGAIFTDLGVLLGYIDTNTNMILDSAANVVGFVDVALPDPNPNDE